MLPFLNYLTVSPTQSSVFAQALGQKVGKGWEQSVVAGKEMGWVRPLLANLLSASQELAVAFFRCHKFKLLQIYLSRGFCTPALSMCRPA